MVRAHVTVTHRVACRWPALMIAPTWSTAAASVLTTPKDLIVSSVKTFTTTFHGDRPLVDRPTPVNGATAINTLTGAITILPSTRLQAASLAVSVTTVSTIQWAEIVNSANRSSTRLVDKTKVILLFCSIDSFLFNFRIQPEPSPTLTYAFLVTATLVDHLMKAFVNRVQMAVDWLELNQGSVIANVT